LQKEAVECYQRALKTENLRKELLAYVQKRLRTLNYVKSGLDELITVRPGVVVWPDFFVSQGHCVPLTVNPVSGD